MKKGFTLIELLAVIVILAIIALIATPIILGIINDAREEAEVRTAELVASSVELAYTGYLFDHEGNKPAALCDFMTDDYFAMDGATQTCASETSTVTVGEDTYTVTFDGAQATVKGGTNVHAGLEAINVKLATN